MSAETLLSSADLRFINLVATRRFGDAEPPAEPRGLEEALESIGGASPHLRGASLAHALLSRGVFPDAALPTALLAMACQLQFFGLQLLAPQGAIAGMVRELAIGEVGVATVARWLEDRAMPASSEF